MVSSAYEAATSLDRLLPGKVVMSTHSDYQRMVEMNWSTRTWQEPPAFVAPTTPDEIATFLQEMQRFGSRFAIRSGGHMPLPGWSSSADSIVLSLEHFDKLEIDNARGVVRIGTGCRWGTVYTALEEKGFSVAGGHYADVGVGGYLLGGGASYFIASHGWGCDSVSNYELVLADGSLVHAHASKNNDLFWALKGGGNNFGIVVAFEMELITLAAPKLWGGNLVYDAAHVRPSIDALANFQRNIDPTKAAADVGFAVVLNFEKDINVASAAIFAHTGSEDGQPQSLNPLFAVPTVSNTMSLKPLSQMAREAGGGMIFQKGQRYNYGQVTVAVDNNLYQEAYDLFEREYQQLKDVTGGCFTFGFQAVPKSTMAASRARGGNCMGVPEMDLCRITINSAWAEETHDTRVLQADTALLAAVAQAAQRHGVLYDYIGMNNAGMCQDVIRSYGKENISRLRKVSRKYDNALVFQKLCNGGFKLGVEAI